MMPKYMLRRTLLSLLLMLCGSLSALAAEPVYLQVTSPHFTVITDAGEKQARHVLDNFERMRWVFQKLFPKSNVDPSLPMVVLAMKNKKGFQAVEPEEALGKGQLDLAGLFLKTQDKNFILLRLDAEGDNPFATVYHEYTHLQYSAAEEWMPLWLFEGVAEFFQNTTIHDKDVQVGETDVNEILYLRQNRLIPLETLLRVDHDSPYYHQEDKGSAFYAESWALTHMLLINDRSQKTNHLGEYMTLMSQGADPVGAAMQAFGDLKKLQTALGYYVQQSAFMHFVMNSGAAPIDETTFTVKELDRNAYDVARADFMVGEGRTKDAQALLEAVMLADPKNAAAREAMGALAFRNGDRVGARKWYSDAIALDSGSYLAHYYFAALSLQDYGAGDDAIEKNLREAIRLNPGFAPAYDELAAYFGMRREKLDEAQMLSAHAVQLDGGNVRFRVDAGNVLRERGKLDDAERVLKIAAKLAKNPGEAAMVQNQLSEIQRERSYASQAVTSESAGVTTATVALPTVNGKEVTVVAEAETKDSAPKHPAEARTGPKHTVTGVLRHVVCSYPAVMDFEVVTAARPAAKAPAKTVTLYSSNYYKMDLSALGFTPKAEMNMCKDLEGLKGQVEYYGSTDKSVDGQAGGIVLLK